MGTSLPTLTAASGCWLSDPLNNFFGRRGCIFISAVFCALSPIGSAVAQSECASYCERICTILIISLAWEQLFVTRLLLGIGMGCKGASIPIFAAENARTCLDRPSPGTHADNY